MCREREEQYVQHVADRLTHAANHEKGSEQRTVKKVRVTGNMLGDLAQQTSAAIELIGQDVKKKTRQFARQG